MKMEHAAKCRSICLSALLLVIGALSLTVHFRIYHQTSASAFVNQPVFYYNRFYIRDSHGQTRDISLQVGFWSYITAALSVASLGLGMASIVVVMKKTHTANHGGAARVSARVKMSTKPLHPAIRLLASGALSVVVLFVFQLAGSDPRWLIVLGGVAAAAFVLLIPVLLRGDSWQKMLAGILLFVPCFGLLLAATGIASSL